MYSFMPMVPDPLKLDDPSVDRTGVLTGLRILLLHKNHKQYVPIIAGCGAEAIELFSYSNGWKEVVDRAGNSKESSYILKDEFTGKADQEVECIIAFIKLIQIQRINHCLLCGARYLELGTVAKAILQPSQQSIQMEGSSQCFDASVLPDTQQSFQRSLGSPESEEYEQLKVYSTSKSHLKTVPFKRKEVFDGNGSEFKKQRTENCGEIANKDNLIDAPSPRPNAEVLSSKTCDTIQGHPAFHFSEISASPKRPPPSSVAPGESDWISAAQPGQPTSIQHAVDDYGRDTTASLSLIPSLVTAPTVERTIKLKCTPQIEISVQLQSNGRSRFKKNFIRRSDDTLRICRRDMNVLLPKESEREIQVLI